MQLRWLAKTVGVDSVILGLFEGDWKRRVLRPDALEVVKETLHSKRFDRQKLANNMDCVRIVLESVNHVLSSGHFIGDV